MGKTKPEVSEPENQDGKIRLGFSLTLEAARLLKELGRKKGHSQTAVVESAIREMAAREGVQ